MRLLVIEFGSISDPAHHDSLQAVCNRYEPAYITQTDALDDVLYQTADNYDGLILAGEYIETAGRTDDTAQFQTLSNMVANATIPVLGVGRGFEIICARFGVQLPELAYLQPGATKILPTEEGAKLLQGSDPLCVAAINRWCVDTLPKSLVKLTTSASGVDCIRHKKAAVYGLQFYPSDFTYPSDGRLVFDNILSMFGQQQR